jgi:hypothetical protein
MAKQQEETQAPAQRKSAGMAPRTFDILDSRTGKIIERKTGTKNQLRKKLHQSLKVGTWRFKQV